MSLQLAFHFIEMPAEMRAFVMYTLDLGDALFQQLHLYVCVAKQEVDIFNIRRKASMSIVFRRPPISITALPPKM
ncbi:MAG: hypothetical protein ACE5FI_10510 [Anaerolineales bacterium]